MVGISNLSSKGLFTYYISQIKVFIDPKATPPPLTIMLYFPVCVCLSVCPHSLHPHPWILPVTAKREQVSKKEEDNTTDQENMVGTNKTIPEYSFVCNTYGKKNIPNLNMIVYTVQYRWRRMRLWGSTFEEGILHALAVKVDWIQTTYNENMFIISNISFWCYDCH